MPNYQRDFIKDIDNLSKNTDFTATLFQSLVGYAIIAADFDGNIIAYNEGARQIYGYDPEEIFGKENIDIFFPRDFIEAGYFQQFISVLLATGRFSYEGEKVRKNGDRFPAQLLSTLTKDKTGKVVGFVEIVQDLTQRKRVEQELRLQSERLAETNNELQLEIVERKRSELELQKAKEAAEAANRSKDQFLANVSHEIRTPMNAILGMTVLALSTALTAEQREYLVVVKQSADNLLAVINDVLDLSKIEAGKLELESLELRLRGSLGDALRVLVVGANEKGLELACDVHPDVPEWLLGDPGRLRQIITNLVGNAIKFTERGKVVVSVEAQSREGEDVCLHFRVSDTGIGIPLEKQTLIFAPFVQADGSTTRKYGGTGLGLTIASRLVEAMRGTIWVESKVGEGSVFHFTAHLAGVRGPSACPPSLVPDESRGLPLPAAGDRASSRSQSGGVMSQDPPLPSRGQQRSLRILLAEDNPFNQRVATIMLTKRGHTVVATGNGREALDVLGRQPFDLVLMDVQMPEIDGFQATAAIRSEEKRTGRHIPIIAMTAHAMREDRARCLEAGMDGYVTKPIDEDRLWQAIGSCVPSPVEAGEAHRREGTDVDLDAALARVDGDRVFLCEMTRLFLDECPRWMGEIRAAIAQGQPPRLRDAAHTLKNWVGNFFAPAVFEAVRTMEEIGRTDNLQAAEPAYAALQGEIERLTPVLAAFAGAPAPSACSQSPGPGN